MAIPHFISEAIQPDRSTFGTGRMATGEPGLPRCFTWRGTRYEIATVLRAWHEAGPCRHGSGEQYVRRHCYEVRLTTGAVATVYFDRQARARSRATKRWWLLTLADSPGGPLWPEARRGPAPRQG